MASLAIVLSVFLFIVAIVTAVGKRHFKSQVAQITEYMTKNDENLGSHERLGLEAEKTKNSGIMGLLGTGRNITATLAILLFCGGFFFKGFFYLEPSHNAHGRTFFGSEFAYTGQGWHFSGWGVHSLWKKYFSVATTDEKGVTASVVKRAYRVRMLDQVDGLLSTTVRYKLPDDPEQFKAIARAFRTPANLLSAALVPPIKETMNATSSLMGAEEYYNGGRTQFANEFDSMMSEGIYSLRRIEVLENRLLQHKGSANASKGTEQDVYGESAKIVFKVIKDKDPETGLPTRKVHNFIKWGITVETAIVTEFIPNDEFVDRMKLKQKASADRAIAREQRIQEEEQKLLAEATGAREVAQAQAAELKIQIQKTTEAETEKQLAITRAEKLKTVAKTAEETATINLRITKLTAAGIKVAADAEAYRLREVMEADGALDKNLLNKLQINQAWATAYANRKVSQYDMSVVGVGATGKDQNASFFQSMLNARLAKELVGRPAGK